MRALIVDDDTVFASTVQLELLRDGDMTIDAATSFAAANALLDSLTYDLLVLDLDLGDRQTSGITILGMLRERSRTLPAVLVISAHVPTYLREMLEFYPLVAATLQKPVEPAVVAKIVREIAART